MGSASPVPLVVLAALLLLFWLAQRPWRK